METTTPTTATLCARDLPISRKMAIEICREIRLLPLAKAERLLNDVVTMKRALRVRRFDFDLSHKAGLGPARFPISAASTFIHLLHSVKANAEQKGLHPEKLIISVAKADQGPRRYHSGRQLRTKMKSTHVELHVQESAK